jgi:hypothetical protein
MRLSLAALALAGLAALPLSGQQASTIPLAGSPGEKGGTDDTGAYTVVPNWYAPLERPTGTPPSSPASWTGAARSSPKARIASSSPRTAASRSSGAR